jgi:hypothetical protein
MFCTSAYPCVVAVVLLGQPGVLEEHFGFRYDFLGVVAAMVAGFCVLFAVVFALAIKCLNFQRR